MAVGAALAAILFAGQASAAIDDTSFAQCAAVGDPTARLACYDALAGRAPATVAPAPATAPPAADFGKPSTAPKPAESLSARVVGSLREWQRGTVIKLDNGQVWKVVGDEQGYYPNVPPNPEVTITKTFFGGYVLEIRGFGRKIKVRRIS